MRLPEFYRCTCGWFGDVPSMTDASEERIENGVVVIDRIHYAICPHCFEKVSRRAANADTDKR